MAWSGFGQTHLVQKQLNRCAGIIWLGFWQDAASLLPVSHFWTQVDECFFVVSFFFFWLAGLFVCALAGTILLSNINYDAKLCLPAMLLYNT